MNKNEIKIIGHFGEYNDNGKLMPAAQLNPSEDFKFDANSVAALCICTFNAFEVYVSEEKKEEFKSQFMKALNLMFENNKDYAHIIQANEP